MTEKKNKAAAFFINGVVAAACAIWCISVVIYFFNGTIITPVWDFVFSAIGVVIACIGVFFVYNYVTRSFSGAKRRWVLTAFVMVVYFVMSLRVPFSPNHDSFDVMFFIKNMAEGKGMSEYANAYMSFYATNRVMLWIYYPFTAVIDGIAGIKAANITFIGLMMLFTSASVRRMAGQLAGELSLMVLLPLCPFLLMSGPYIYPPAVFLCALCIYLYVTENIYAMVFFYIAAGALFTMRPLCLGPVLVYIVVCDFTAKDRKHMYIKAILRITSILAVCLLTKWYIAEILYLTGVHPYPKMTSAADLWTFEVGMRPNGADTGLCKYMPGDTLDNPMDEIAQKFSQLWNYYIYGKPEDYKKVITLQSQLRGMLFERAGSTIFSSWGNFTEFFGQKFNNYFADSYKPYFYAADLNSADASRMLYGNYDVKYFLYENMVMFLFGITGGIVSLVSLVKCIIRRRLGSEERKTLIMALGVVCTVLVSILFTEVGKRLMFDCFVPMCIVICISVSRLCGAAVAKTEKMRIKRISAIGGTACCILCMIGVVSIYNKSNIDIFKNCKVEVTNSDIYIYLEKPVAEKGCVIEPVDSGKVKLDGKEIINIPNGKNKPVYARFRDKSGNEMIISKMRQLYSTEVISEEEREELEKRTLETAE